MTAETPAELRAWVRSQVERYAAARPAYQAYADTLAQILRGAANQLAPLSIVQARAKTVPSFAEKILRKRRPDPLREFTDLCGGRVIARTRGEAELICKFIVDHFEIDWENSVDTSRRLRPTEFGYRSVHYIVSVRDDVDYGVPIPASVRGLKAEVQVRTVAEHAWCDFAHDFTYKSSFRVPEAWLRELAEIAATLEQVDEVFDRIEKRLVSYSSSYGRHMADAETREEIERLQIVLEHDPLDALLADRIARLAMVLGDWQLVADLLPRFVAANEAATPMPVLRDLGTALCKLNASDPVSERLTRGRRYLDIAASSGDSDAICSLAGSWKGLDDEKARQLYQRAVDIDPADPYALGNYLELQVRRSPGTLESARPLVRGAIARCRQHIEAEINLPWAQLDLGRFLLFVDEPYAALDAYAAAIAGSTAAFMLESALASLEGMETSLAEQPGFDWCRRLLLLGLATRFRAPAAMKRIGEMASSGLPEIQAPIVLIAGATDARLAEQLRPYSSLLRAAFSEYRGTIISGGVTQGVPGLAGEIGVASGGAIRTIGYLPSFHNGDATPDPDYSELRRTTGSAFSPLEPLQAWTDLVTAGISADSVKLIGVGGGRVSAAEYRIALALGATVGLLAESGGEAARLLTDERLASQRLVTLPEDRESIRAFVAPRPAAIADALREALGRAVHEEYRRERFLNEPEGDPSLASWEQLPADLRASNLAQADDVASKLERIGCKIVPAGASGEPAAPTPEETEELAQMEHGRWVAERLLSGWTYGESRDPAHKKSPDLVPWSALPEKTKDLDRQAVQRIAQLLEGVGLSVRRVS